MTARAPIEARYRPLIELGRGGTARVYLAESLTSGLKKLVVLKTLEPELSVDLEMRNLFRREAEVCARLNHPNIVQVYEVVEQAGGPVIVMEYVEGISLSRVVSLSADRFPKRLHLHTLTQCLAGLHYFHELRDYDRTTALEPVHRDVSPQNVIVTYEGAVKVLDFGIAKLANQENRTTVGVVKGKLHYMPAEQLLSDTTLDRRADIFAVGVMLWEALAERRLWQGKSEQNVFEALLRNKVPNLRDAARELPPYFYEIVAKATAHEKNDRHGTALELHLDIERMLVDLGGLVQPRELAEFMRTEFAKRRMEQETAISEATAHPVSARWHVTVSREYTLTPLQELERTTTTQGTRATNNKMATKRRWLLLGTVALLCTLLAMGLSLKRRQLPTQLALATASSALSAHADQSISISVVSDPVGAMVLLDGQALGRSPWHGTVPARKQTATVELHADDYEPLSKVISLRENVAIDVQLRPVAPSVQFEPEAIERKPGKEVKSVGPTGGKTVPKRPKCNPPYAISSDGIRIYKPECF